MFKQATLSNRVKGRGPNSLSTPTFLLPHRRGRRFLGEKSKFFLAFSLNYILKSFRNSRSDFLPVHYTDNIQEMQHVMSNFPCKKIKEPWEYSSKEEK
jgi:hypothetical protein